MSSLTIAESNPFLWRQEQRFIMIFLSIFVTSFACIGLGVWFEKQNNKWHDKMFEK